MTKARYSLILLSTLLILAFTLSPVLAQGIPPGTIDDDGDELLGELPAWAETNQSYPEAILEYEGSFAVDGGPTVPSPVNETFTKFPDYYFFTLPGATKYRVKVYNFFTNELIYTLKGSGDCEFGYCYLRPVLGLKFVDLSGAKGYYYWKRESKVGDAWILDPTTYNFRVYSTGFTSLFTTLDNKWKPVYGTWSFTTAGYLKTKPVQGQYSSTVHKFKFTDDFSFEVKMKRKDEASAENFIIVKGFPDIDDVNEDGWYQGISFGYNNAGNCRLDRWNLLSRETISDWAYGCNVKPYDWNVLSIFVHDGMLYAYMNGVEIYKIADSVDYGWVGLGGYEDDSVGNALLVDYARLWMP